MARKCVPEVAPSTKGVKTVGSNGSTMFRKSVKMPLTVFVEGKNKAEVAERYDTLVGILAKNLPLKFREGRGKLTTITVEAKA